MTANRRVARPGEVIAHGPIPDNVVEVRDSDDEPGTWRLTSRGHWHCGANAAACESAAGCDVDYGDPLDFAPLTVTAVREEPGEDPAPSGLCEVGPDRVNCIVAEETHRRIYHGGRTLGEVFAYPGGMECPVCGSSEPHNAHDFAAVREPEPAAEPQPESDLLDLVRQYGDEWARAVKVANSQGGYSAAQERRAAAAELFARIEAEVQRLRDKQAWLHRELLAITAQRDEAMAERVEQAGRDLETANTLAARLLECERERDKARADYARIVENRTAWYDRQRAELERLKAAAAGRTEQARDYYGVPLWIHGCGNVRRDRKQPGPDTRCDCFHRADTWRPLLVATDAPQQDGPVVLTLPEGTHLAYTIYHECEWWLGLSDELRPNGGRKTVQVAASARGAGGGVAWEFGIQQHDGIGLKLGIFDETWPAFAQMPSFFTALAAGKVKTLDDVVTELRALGAVDETERPAPPREPRTWPKLDDAPEGEPPLRGASGEVYRCSHYTEGVPVYRACDETTGELVGRSYSFYVLQHLDGPLTEVFDDEAGTR